MKNGLYKTRIKHLEENMHGIPNNVMNEGVPVGKLLHNFIKDRKVYIDLEQSSKQMFFSGETGSGKTSILYTILQYALDKVCENPDTASGFCFIDPVYKGANGFVTRVYKCYKEGRLNDLSKIHYFKYTTATQKITDPLTSEKRRDMLYDCAYIPGHNLLAFDPEFDDVLATTERVQASIDILLPNATKAIKTEKYIKNAIGALLLDREEIKQNGKTVYRGIPHSIVEVIDFIRSETMREKILKRIDPNKGQPYLEFWKRDGDLAPETLDAIETRLYGLTASQDMRRVFGQTEESMDFSHYMDDGHIVLIDLGHIENEGMKKLIGSHIISSFYNAAKNDRQKTKRRFYLYVDELTQAEAPVIPKITSDARQFGLIFAPMTQEINQLKKETQDALQRVGNHFILRQSSLGAPVVNRIINKEFTEKFLRELDDGVILLKTRAKIKDKGEPVICLIKADPPYIYDENGDVLTDYNDDVKDLAARKFAYKWAIENFVRRDFKPIEEVDYEFFKTRGIAGVVKNPNAENTAVEKTTETTEYNSTNIDKTFVPVDVDFINY